MMAARGFRFCRAGFAGRGTASARSTRRSTLALRLRPETRVSGRCIEHALAARAEDHLCVALDLVEELGWDAHAAALADSAAHLDHCEAAATREDHLVLAPEVAVDRLHQLRACGALALDLGGEACERLAQLARLAVALRREPRELGREARELRRGPFHLLHHGHQLGLERADLLLEQIHLAPGQPELLVVADAGYAHAAVLHLGLGGGETALEVALARAERRQLHTRRARGGRLGAHGLLQCGHPPLALGHGAGLGAQALIHQLQRRQDLDLRRHLPPSRRTRHPDRRWWAQWDSNTRPTGYGPAALTPWAIGPL